MLIDASIFILFLSFIAVYMIGRKKYKIMEIGKTLTITRRNTQLPQILIGLFSLALFGASMLIDSKIILRSNFKLIVASTFATMAFFQLIYYALRRTPRKQLIYLDEFTFKSQKLKTSTKSITAFDWEKSYDENRLTVIVHYKDEMDRAKTSKVKLEGKQDQLKAIIEALNQKIDYF